MTNEKYRQELSRLTQELKNAPTDKQDKLRSKIHALKMFHETYTVCPEVMEMLS